MVYYVVKHSVSTRRPMVFGGLVTYVHALILSHLEIALRPLTRLDQGLDLGMIHDSGIDHMISRKPESIVAKNPWLP